MSTHHRKVWKSTNPRLKGADAVLLIASVLPGKDIKCMNLICKALILQLIKLHDEEIQLCAIL